MPGFGGCAGKDLLLELILLLESWSSHERRGLPRELGMGLPLPLPGRIQMSALSPASEIVEPLGSLFAHQRNGIMKFTHSSVRGE